MIPSIEERQYQSCDGCIIHYYRQLPGLQDWRNFCVERNYTTDISLPCKYRLTIWQLKDLIDRNNNLEIIHKDILQNMKDRKIF